MINNNSKTNAHTSSKAQIHILILSVLLVVLTSCVLSPLYTQIENDITFMYTVFPSVLNYIIILFETAYMALLFAFVSYTTYSSNKDSVKNTIYIMYVIAVVALKHVLNLTLSSIIDGYIDVAFDIPVTALLLLADLLILTIVWMAANHKCKKHFIHAKKMQKASKYLNTIEYNESTAIYPFNGFFNIRNPIIFPIFIGCLISTALLIIQRLYADFVVLGAPASIYEVIEIILAYIIDILLGLAGYSAAYFAASYIFLRKDISIQKQN